MDYSIADLINWLVEILGPSAGFSLLAGLAVMIITDVIKATSKGVGGKITKLGWIKLSGAGTLLLATGASYFAVNKYGINILDLFETFKNTDPELAEVITTVVVLCVARWLDAVGIELPKGLLKAGPEDPV